MDGTPDTLFSSGGLGVVIQLLSFFGGFLFYAQLASYPTLIQKGKQNPSPGDLGDVKLLLTQQPPNELSVNESEADGLDCSGNTPEI